MNIKEFKNSLLAKNANFMKKYIQTRLFILLLSSFCFSHISAQSDVMLNTGKMAIESTDKSKTILYIDGNILVGTAENTTSAIRLEEARIVLTGNFINNVSKGTIGGTVFVSPSANKGGVFEFRGLNTPQMITTNGTAYAQIPSKLDNYINFPHLEINNDKHVTISPQLAVKTQDINLTKGWLIVDSDLATLQKDGATDADNQTVLAHLYVNGNINYNRSAWNTESDVNKRGFIDVRLKIPSEGDRTIKSIVGFGSPFKELRADYFMYNTLLAPDPTGFLGTGPILEPKTVMTAGKGYVLGIDLRGLNPDDYFEEPYEGIEFSQRAHNGHYFNRHKYSTDPTRSANQIFGTDASLPPYQNEVLNTDNVNINLSRGYNYLSNPFTTPLNIDALLGNNEAQSWNIVSDVVANQPQLSNRVWVLEPNSSAEPVAGNITRTKYTYNYYLAMRTGGTYTDDDNVSGVTALAPLQMFVIYAYSTANSITIPKDERVSATTKFTRNTKERTPRRDDFIIEFRDLTTHTTDRTSFVVRSGDEIASNNNYRNVNRLESVSTQSDKVSRSMQAEGIVNQGLASQIYTKDETGKALTVQFFTDETKSFTLYHTPSSVAQPINIRGLRLSTMDQITEMWLEDKKYGIQKEITPDMVYETTSVPTDKEDRFVIHFKRGSSDLEEDERSTLYAYEVDKTIWVDGFDIEDIGGKVQFIDMNGRILAEKNITGERLELYQNSSVGAYLIKVASNRLKILKFLSK